MEIIRIIIIKSFLMSKEIISMKDGLLSKMQITTQKRTIINNNLFGYLIF